VIEFFYFLNNLLAILPSINFILRTHKDHSRINFNKFIKELLPKFNGRGGGKPDMAQGSADAASVEAFIQQLVSACEQF